MHFYFSARMTVPSRFHPLQDSFERLSRLLRKSNYPATVLDIEGCLLGRSHALLPPLRHLLFEVSKQSAADFAEKYGLAPTNSDLKLVEIFMKILRFEYNILPPLTATQFMSTGFAQKKLDTLCLLAEKMKMQKTKIVKPSKLVEEAQPVPPQPQENHEESEITEESADSQQSQLSAILTYLEGLTARFSTFEERLETVSARVNVLEITSKLRAAEDPVNEGSVFARAADKMRDTEELLQKLSLKKLNASGA